MIEIIILLEPGFGAKEPPPGTPDQAGLRIKSFIEIKNFVGTRFWYKGAAAWYPRSSGAPN